MKLPGRSCTQPKQKKLKKRMTYYYWNSFTALFNTTFQLCQIEQTTVRYPFFACEFSK